MQYVPRDWVYRFKEEMNEYKNTEVSLIIDEYIHNDRNREIMKSRLIDGWTYERIAEFYDMSDRQIKRIVYKCEEIIFKHL